MAGPPTIQAFGQLAAGARQHGPSAEERAARARTGAPEPVLTLGNYGLTDVDPAVRKRRGVAVPVSVGLHAGAAVALALVPVLLAGALPEPASDIRAFFAGPLSAPAPPPPPPPPAARPAVAARPAPKAAAASGFVAPIEVPEEIRPEQGVDLGVEGGVPGGVEGGVPGGVVGGVIGGLPDAPPPPAKPVRVGGDVREPRKILDAAPAYPDLALKAHVEGIVIIEATIDVRGRVADAKVLRGVPMLDEAALEAVRKWVYTPTLLSGVPTPVIMTVTVNFRLKPAMRG
jgi:protein TonB